MSEIKEVYNSIYKDFDRTRYSVWRGVKKFLDVIPTSDKNNIEIGCGNGKNLSYRPELNFEGVDISSELVKVCKEKGLRVKEGDILNLELRDNFYDNVLCVAVIHHLPNRLERVRAISELIRIVKPGGKILIYVWAIEQTEGCQSRVQKWRSLSMIDKKDKLVPFQSSDGRVLNRFYHFYSEGELIQEILESCKGDRMIKIEKEEWEMGNWVVQIKKS